jgi:hypothetical protein
MSEIKPEDIAIDDSQVFNDAELEDIMSEIESLETDHADPAGDSSLEQGLEAAISGESVEGPETEAFIEESAPREDLAVAQVGDGDLQVDIDADIEAAAGGDIFDQETVVAEVVDDVSIDFDDEPVAEAEPQAEVQECAPEPVAEEVHEEVAEPVAHEEVVEESSHEAEVVSLSEHAAEASITAGPMNLSLNFDIAGTPVSLKMEAGKCLWVEMNGAKIELSEDGCQVSMEGGVTFHVPTQLKKAA